MLAAKSKALIRRWPGSRSYFMPSNRNHWWQRQLLLDLGGRYLHACMRKFYPRIRPLLHLQEAQPAYPPDPDARFAPPWFESASNVAKIQAFVRFNLERQPQPLFSTQDLEALIAAHMLQDTDPSSVWGSMISMALGVSDYNLEDCTPTPPLPAIKGVDFATYNPRNMTKKLLLAVFRILFRREVEDVEAQFHQCRYDTECMVLMGLGRRTYSLPPLLDAYLNQSFGLQAKTRIKAFRNLESLKQKTKEASEF